MTSDLVILLVILLAIVFIDLGTRPRLPGRRRREDERDRNSASVAHPLVALQPVRIPVRNRRFQ